MKPFFEAGLKDLALTIGYPAHSIQSCSNFKRTHRFLLETWESLYRLMLLNFLATHKQSMPITFNRRLALALQELQNNQTNKMAIYCTFRFLQEEMNEHKILPDFHKYIKKMSELDDTWKFWAQFVFEDCLPYIGLFLAIRSENWQLRMASLKSMALTLQRLIIPLIKS